MTYSTSGWTAVQRIQPAILAALVAFSVGPVGVQPDLPVAATPSGRPQGVPVWSSPAPVAGEADGVVPEGTTVFDDRHPAVKKLKPDLLLALRRAATAAGKEGLVFFVNSGWRSRKYQNALLEEAVSRYGSEREAARWVATATTSPHVSGNAVDLGPAAATTWLSREGARYGLCQIYNNEPWHFELRPQAKGKGCPPRYSDPTHDPRMQ
ncbi:M15 family metallopeptidase [Deinococcus roseus]|nr:M15 family metallopeptidase [Deinococcus roseus]